MPDVTFDPYMKKNWSEKRYWTHKSSAIITVTQRRMVRVQCGTGLKGGVMQDSGVYQRKSIKEREKKH